MDNTSPTFESHDDVAVIAIPDSRITHDTGESMHELLPSAPNPLKVVLDLSNITFLGSIGLTVLVVFLKRIKTAGGHLVIAGLTGQSREVMLVTRLDKAFEFRDDIGQAIAMLQAR